MEIKQIIQDVAKSYNFDCDIALIIAAKESAFNPAATGADGEYGLFQLLPSTWDEVASKIGLSDPWDARQNAQAGIYYISRVIPAYFRQNGVYPHLTNCLRAYNGGMGNVKRGTVSTAAKNYAKDAMIRFIKSKLKMQ